MRDMNQTLEHDACVTEASDDIHPLAVPSTSDLTLARGTPLPVSRALFDNVGVQAQLVVGEVRMNVGQLMRMCEGDVLESDRLVHQPVDVIVNGHLVARGELVAAGNNFGVRITQIQAGDTA